MDERKIDAIVLEVTSHAIAAVWILHPEERVITLMRGQAVGNFLMAFQAFESWRAGPELVARGALCGAVEALMRFRERPGRNLAANFASAEEDAVKYQQKSE